MADLDSVLQRDPNYLDALFLRGAIKFQRDIAASEWVNQDDLDGALADFSKVIDLQPRASRAYYLRGMAKKTDGDRDGMIADLIESYKIDPNDSQVIAVLEQVEPNYRAIAEPLNNLLQWPAAPGRRSN